MILLVSYFFDQFYTTYIFTVLILKLLSCFYIHIFIHSFDCTLRGDFQNYYLQILIYILGRFSQIFSSTEDFLIKILSAVCRRCRRRKLFTFFFFSKTIRSISNIFSTKHCLAGGKQVFSNEGHAFFKRGFNLKLLKIC